MITGASSGIGRAAALQAAAAGDHVVLVARGRPGLETVASQCLDSGAASALVVPTDIGDDRAVRRCVKRARGINGGLDVVLNCAGVVAYGRTEEVPVHILDTVMRTNVLGAVNIVRHTLPVLRAQRHGALVLIGSVIGHIAVPGMTPYVLSKWSVRALARQVALENRDLPQLHVVYLSPGGVDTPIYGQAANYSGFIGRPPPPVSSPEHVAQVALRATTSHRTRIQVGLANNLMRIGFTALPWVFDALVGPLFTMAAMDRTTPVKATTGNVLESNPEGNDLHGHQGNAALGILANLGSLFPKA